MAAAAHGDGQRAVSAARRAAVASLTTAMRSHRPVAGGRDSDPVPGGLLHAVAAEVIQARSAKSGGPGFSAPGLNCLGGVCLIGLFPDDGPA